MKQLSQDYDFVLLGHFGEEAWLVRFCDVSNFDDLLFDDNVRWAGSMLPSWRLSPALDGTQDYFSLVVSPDLESDEFSKLVSDLQEMGATDAWCGSHICEVRGVLDLALISHDRRIIFVEPSSGLVLNNAAASVADAVSISNTSIIIGIKNACSISTSSISSSRCSIRGMGTICRPASA